MQSALAVLEQAYIVEIIYPLPERYKSPVAASQFIALTAH